MCLINNTKTKCLNNYLFFFITLLTIIIKVDCIEENNNSKIKCGGDLIELKGIIQTPNFPNKFQVPIQCKWIIDNKDVENKAIIIYLTQLFVTSGLTITEYSVFIAPWLDPNVIFTANEHNVLATQWIKTNKQYVVIDFELDKLYGTHIRALDNLLNVFGFNITYEIVDVTNSELSTNLNNDNDELLANNNKVDSSDVELSSGEELNGVRKDVCNVLTCSFTGHCYANENFTAYYCSCFEGFSGDDCGDGPLCKNGQTVCENGARCRHTGSVHIMCACPEGFTGVRCEVPVNLQQGPDCKPDDILCDHGGQSLVCPYTQDITPCRCSNEEAQPVSYDKARFEIAMGLNATSTDIHNLTLSLNRTISKLFRGLSKIEKFQVLNVIPNENVIFHFIGLKSDGEKFHMTLTKLLDRSKIGSFNFIHRNLDFLQEPVLQNKALLLNQKDNRVREGAEFILSCIGEGSKFLEFHWFKDDIPINVDYSMREMWMKVSPRDSHDQYVSTLGIQNAQKLDQGRYTCQIVDLGYQHCQSIDVEILTKPEVKIIPMSITLEKGDDLIIKCMSPDEINSGNSSEKFGYNWIKNHALFPMNIDSEVWEDLEPGGSILKIKNIQKSASYSCQVRASHVSSSSALSEVLLINKTIVPVCPANESYGFLWPDTSNGATAYLDCPRGVVSRRCVLIDAKTPQWQLPDFSKCVPHTLYVIQTNFKSLMLGYQTTSINLTLQHTADYLSSVLVKYPGETESTVNLLNNILSLIKHTQSWNSTKMAVKSAAEYFYIIINYLLYHQLTFVNRDKIIELQAILEIWSLIWCNQMISDHKRFLLDSLIIDIRKLYNLTSGYISVHQPSISFKNSNSTICPNTSVILESSRELIHSKSELNVIIVSYSNLSRYLHSRYVTENDVLYEIHSTIVTVILGTGDSGKLKKPELLKHLKIEVEFPRPSNTSIPAGWNVTCGMSENKGKSWRMTCSTRIKPSSILCQCNDVGLYALLITLDKNQAILTTSSQPQFHILVGFISCILEVLVTLLYILPRWFRRKTYFLFLKLNFCIVIILIMIMFIYTMYYNPVSKIKLSISLLIIIQYFILISISCHLSETLIIYTQVIVHHSLMKNIKQTIMKNTFMKQFKLNVIVILNVLSLLIILCLAVIMFFIININIYYYICILSTLIYVIFYICLASYVLYNIKYMKHNNTKSNNSKMILTALCKRERILLKSFCLMFATCLVYASSIIFIIHYNNVTVQYIFAFSCFILGFVIFLCYFVHSTSYQSLKLKSPTPPDDDVDVFETDSDIDCLDIFTIQEKEVESKSSPDSRCVEESIPLTESVNSSRNSSNNNSKAHKMVTFCHDLVKDSNEMNSQYKLDLVPYHTDTTISDTIAPPPAPPLPSFTSPSSMDVLTTHVCVELITPDSIENNENKKPKLVLCSVDVEPGNNQKISEVTVSTTNDSCSVTTALTQNINSNYSDTPSLQHIPNSKQRAYNVENNIETILNQQRGQSYNEMAHLPTVNKIIINNRAKPDATSHFPTMISYDSNIPNYKYSPQHSNVYFSNVPIGSSFVNTSTKPLLASYTIPRLKNNELCNNNAMFNYNNNSIQGINNNTHPTIKENNTKGHLDNEIKPSHSVKTCLDSNKNDLRPNNGLVHNDNLGSRNNLTNYPTSNNSSNDKTCDSPCVNSILVNDKNMIEKLNDKGVSNLFIDGIKVNDIKNDKSKSINNEQENVNNDTLNESAPVATNVNGSAKSADESSNNMMTQISNDLNYLLNTDEDFTSLSLKRRKKNSLSSISEVPSSCSSSANDKKS